MCRYFILITELVCTLYSDWRHVSVDFIQPRSNRNLVFFIFFSSPITVEPNARKVKMFVIPAARFCLRAYSASLFRVQTRLSAARLRRVLSRLIRWHANKTTQTPCWHRARCCGVFCRSSSLKSAGVSGHVNLLNSTEWLSGDFFRRSRTTMQFISTYVTCYV